MKLGVKQRLVQSFLTIYQSAEVVIKATLNYRLKIIVITAIIITNQPRMCNITTINSQV